MKIAVLTLGCKTNQAESMQIEHALNNEGHQIVGLSEKPDLCIINTCTVTSKADYQSRQLINRALKNNSRVIVTGCYAELNHEKLKKTYSDIIIAKNNEKSYIINMILQKASSDNGALKNYSITTLPHNSIALSGSRHRPIVKVQDGCNYSCTYCAIPMARGRSRSVPEDEVIKEIKSYESMGYNEVVLTGIHLGTYGLDLKPKKSLSVLLSNILKNTKIIRIRLSSLEIKEITDDLLNLLVGDRVCKHLHIPLQAGDDNILRMMNRTYSISDFIKGIEKIIMRLPDIAIGTDIIVGFPGEGDVEFNNTKYLVESIPFSYLHVFPYSSRPGTKAALLPKHVTSVIKRERVATLRSIGIAKKQDYIRKQIGKILDVVVENRCEGGFYGTAGNYIKVFIRDENNAKEGMLVNVRISGVENSTATGILAKENITL